MTKLGLHANRTSSHLVPFVRDAKPRIVKFLDHDWGTVKACRDASPGTMLIGRLFTGDQRYQQPRANARAYADKILGIADRFRGLYEAWESYNELEPQNPDEAKLFNEFHVHFAEFMHREGLKVVAFNFSTGVPKLEMWRWYQDGAAASDYIGLHEYDAPTMKRLHEDGLAKGGEGQWLALRYRRVWGLLGPAARKPIIITEAGIDGGVINDTYRDDDGNRVKKLGYKDFVRFNQVSVNGYMDNLAWYDDEMQKDDYVVGACIYCFGSDNARWYSFDLGDDDDPAPQARDALRRTILRPQPALRPVSVTGQFVPPPHEGQPPTDGWWDGAPQPGPAPQPQPTPQPQPAPQPQPTPQPQPVPQPEPTPQPQPVPQPEPTPQPQPAPTPQPQPVPQPVPQPEPTLPPCATPPADWFAARFNSDTSLRTLLGCPTRGPADLFIAEQHFQNGLMIWRSDEKSVTVMLQWGSWRAFPDTWNSEMPEAGFVTPPRGLIEPKRGFGKVWREQLGGGNAAIGFATDNESGMRGAIQPFERGFVLRNGNGVVRILFNSGKWMT